MLEYKLCVNDLLGKVQINSFERVYNTYIWLRKRTSVFKCIAIKLKHYTLGGGCEWGKPTSDKGRKIPSTTDKTRKKLSTTDRKKIN